MLKGLIIGNISNLYYVEVEEKIYECIVRGKIKQTEISPVVGDYVEIGEIENQNKAVILNILPRTMYSKRPKLSNLTQIVLVVSLKMPKPNLYLLDKQLVYAKLNNINPIICINKIDLAKEEDLNYIKNLYEKIGYKVILTNAKEKQGIDELKKVLKGNITAFSGNSGVGKSSLVNAIFNKSLADEGALSKKVERGKNTTTNVKLYKIWGNEYIADTPGFSTFELEIDEVNKENLDEFFIEFKKYLKNCQYMGCNHIKEEKCGIKDAVQKDLIDKSRYENYLKIYEDLKKKEERKWK